MNKIYAKILMLGLRTNEHINEVDVTNKLVAPNPSANGAVESQPGATPWENGVSHVSALKGRSSWNVTV